MDGGSFVPTGEIRDFCNDKVKTILSQLDEYQIQDPDGIGRVEWREMVSLENDGKYEGEWNLKTQKREGKGVQVWHDGSIYEGQWLNDMAHGEGRLVHADGDVYEGEWCEDKAHGHGTYTHTDGAKYTGTW